MCRRTLSRLNRLASVGYDRFGCVGLGSASRNHFDRPIREAKTNMDVAGTGPASGATPARDGGAKAPSSQGPSASVPVGDDIANSAVEKMSDRKLPAPESRAERLARIKEAIERGDYDTDEKLDAALSKMFDSLGIDLGDD